MDTGAESLAGHFSAQAFVKRPALLTNSNQILSKPPILNLMTILSVVLKLLHNMGRDESEAHKGNFNTSLRTRLKPSYYEMSHKTKKLVEFVPSPQRKKKDQAFDK